MRAEERHLVAEVLTPHHRSLCLSGGETIYYCDLIRQGQAGCCLLIKINFSHFCGFYCQENVWNAASFIIAGINSVKISTCHV